jgi:hypothetical protein
LRVFLPFAVALVFQALGFVWLVWPRRPAKAENQIA